MRVLPFLFFGTFSVASLGATGLAQCTELVWHLRGTAGKRQVEGARTALQHNLGLGGACVVTLYQKV
jgi:sterol carrier protein 2